MRISELSAETSVSVATLKFYLRERLLMPGVATSATQASYADEHVQRVRLVRALIDAGGLSVASTRAVIEALENPPDSTLGLLGAAHKALPSRSEVTETGAVDELLGDLGWQVGEQCPARRDLAGALSAAHSAGVQITPANLRRYARAAERIARVDVSTISPNDPPADMLRTVVVGTVMLDPVLAALRRVAQEHVSSERFAG